MMVRNAWRCFVDVIGCVLLQRYSRLDNAAKGDCRYTDALSAWRPDWALCIMLENDEEKTL
jgi:hypothetical protein